MFEIWLDFLLFLSILMGGFALLCWLADSKKKRKTERMVRNRYRWWA